MTTATPLFTTAPFSVVSRHRRMLADTLTPVSIYLRLRDRFTNSILLESSDYHGNDNSFSYICFDPVARFEFDGIQVTALFPNGETEVIGISEKKSLQTYIQAFRESFKNQTQEFPFISNGLFGHITYGAVQYFEDITLRTQQSENEIPLMVYQAFRYVIAINHFKDELYLFEHSYLQDSQQSETDNLDYIESLIKNRNYPTYSFRTTGQELSNVTDEQYLEIVRQGINHCHRGDVFQIVLSRRFSTPFQGDEFNVYRDLRSLNPSPYLFYFDYGNYKIFGSSPESQIVIKNRKATIYPKTSTFIAQIVSA